MSCSFMCKKNGAARSAAPNAKMRDVKNANL